MRRTRFPLALASTVLLMTACGGGDGGDTATGGFVRGQLELVPASAADTEGGSAVQVTMTDLARVADALALDAPAADRAGDDVARWAGDMSGLGEGPLVVFLPGLIGDVNVWNASDDIRADTGIALGGVQRMVSADAPPGGITVMTGDLELSGELGDLGDGVSTFGQGDDLSLDGERTAWNRLGQPVRFATRDGAVAASRTTALAAEFATGDGTSLADVEPFGALGDALDALDVFSALLLNGDFSAANGLPPTASPADRDRFVESLPDIPAFSGVGIGVTTSDEAGPQTVVAYAFGSEADASAAVEPLGAMWRDGEDPVRGIAMAELFEVSASGSSGTVAWVTLVPLTTSTRTPGDLAFQRAPVFLHP